MEALSIAHGRHVIPVKAYREPWFPETVEAANLLFSFHLRRKSEFYLMKGVEPMYACLLFGFFTFVSRPNEIASRLGVQVT